MGHPDPQEPETIEQKVGAIVAGITKDTEGKLQFPEGEISEELEYAARTEFRRRDTESAYTTTSVALQKEKKFTANLKAQLTPKLDLSQDEQARLSDLSVDDPDAWRKEMNELEGKALTTHNETLNKLTETTSQEVELEVRRPILEQFVKDNPDIVITDATLTANVPPKYADALAKGEISFTTYLEKAKPFMTKGKVIVGSKVTETPNLNDASGSNEASEEKKQDVAKDYEKIVF